MSVILWLSLVSFLLFTIQEGNCSIGFDQIENRLENMEKRIEHLVEMTAKSFNVTNERIDELVASDSGIKNMIDGLRSNTENPNLLEKISKLESTGDTILSKQRSAEKQINGIASSVSTLESQTKLILKNHFDLVIPSCYTPKVPGIYRLQFPRINVFCETTVGGGGWLVIQLRSNTYGNTNFYEGSYEYRTGLGTIGPYSEFWLGLEAIHQITNSGEYELRVDVRNESNELKYARYSQFKVSSENDGYRLTIGGHSGTAQDALSLHNNAKFSTYDWNNNNCAKTYKSGWWFPDDCGNSNLNGPYDKTTNGYGIQWGSWTKAGTYSRMMIRRK